MDTSSSSEHEMPCKFDQNDLESLVIHVGHFINWWTEFRGGLEFVRSLISAMQTVQINRTIARSRLTELRARCVDYQIEVSPSFLHNLCVPNRYSYRSALWKAIIRELSLTMYSGISYESELNVNKSSQMASTYALLMIKLWFWLTWSWSTLCLLQTTYYLSCMIVHNKILPESILRPWVDLSWPSSWMNLSYHESSAMNNAVDGFLALETMGEIS